MKILLVVRNGRTLVNLFTIPIALNLPLFQQIVDSDKDDPVSDTEPDNFQLNWHETYEELYIDSFVENTDPSHNLGPNSSELDLF